MKSMKSTLYWLGLALIGAAMLTGCQESFEDVSKSNQAWNTATNPLNTILLDGKRTSTHTMSLAVAQPAATDITATYMAAPEKVEEYNKMYDAKAVMLPEDYYSFDVSNVTIPAGALTSSEAQITFDNLNTLDASVLHVLPVTVESSDFELLQGRTTSYYIFRGAALINVVANMTGTCLRFVDPGRAGYLANLRQFTVEGLLRPGDFANTLHTFIGIEGEFLLRFGDAGLAPNQLQLATRYGNTTNADWKIDRNKWTFVTVTINVDTREMNVYFNGLKKGNTASIGYGYSVDWSVRSDDRACFIGYSWDIDRDFQGDMCEVRIWNRILETSEINEPNHFYYVEPDAEGLVAYWKFNEGEGNTIHDYAKGCDMYVPTTYPGKPLINTGDITWTAVTLPEE